MCFCAILADPVRVRGHRVSYDTFIPHALNQQNLSRTGLVVIILTSEANYAITLIAGHLQGDLVCAVYWCIYGSTISSCRVVTEHVMNRANK